MPPATLTHLAGWGRYHPFVQCACGWEGDLAAIEFTEHETRFVTRPACFLCRYKIRRYIRQQGGRIVRLIPSS